MNPARLFLFVHHRLDGAVLIIEETLHLQGAEVGDIVRGNAVVIEQIPLSLVLHNRVMGGPAYNGLKDDTLIGERTVRIITNSVAQEVAITSRVAVPSMNAGA